MVKRFLLSAAAVAAITGNVIAFDVISENPEITNGNEVEEMNITSENANDTYLIGTYEANNTGLIFPAYYAGNGWESTLKIINTKDRSVVAKVVLFDREKSEEVLDFTIYLSGKDVFVADITVDSNGKVKVISTDNSAPSSTPNTMASDDNPLEVTPKQYFTGKGNVGYIEVIPMVTYNGDIHGMYLRNAYKDFSKEVRLLDPNADYINFSRGVVLDNKVRVPYVNITSIDEIAEFGTSDIEGALSGYIRITNVANGRDMIINGFPVWFATEDENGDDLALVYLEGEKASLLDVAIDTNGSNASAVGYNFTAVIESIKKLNALNTSSGEVKEVYLTYGEAEFNNMYALITQPYKRVAVQQSLRDNNTAAVGSYWNGVGGSTAAVSNYGTLKLVADVYDNHENKMDWLQFSPASTPSIHLPYELGTTGTSESNNTQLPYYLKLAEDNLGYKEGFVILKNATDSLIPGIITQMIATKPGSQILLNWHWPTVRD